MQQNAAQLIPIPWNRINITTISSIISKHSTHTKSPHPHYPLFPSPKTSPGNSRTQPFSILLLPNELQQARFLNHHKQDLMHFDQASTLQVDYTWSLPKIINNNNNNNNSNNNPHLQHHFNRRRIRNPVGHLRWGSFAETINSLRLLAIFADEPYPEYSTGLSIQLYPVT